MEDELEEERVEKIKNEDMDEDALIGDQYKSNEQAYPESEREMGSGPHRILKPIEVREDLYSYIFALSFHPEYVYACEAEANEKQEILKKLR